MAADGITSKCRGCGSKRGSDHCTFPSKKGPEVTDPNHPSNNGKWDDILSQIRSYANKTGGGR
jgi:hypothetical protein